MKFKELLKTKKMRYGINATVLTALFIVAVILVNMLAGVVSEKFPSINIDLSENGQFEISKATKTAIGDISKEVKMIVVLPNRDSDVFLDEFISRYKEVNNNIVSYYINPTKDPVALQKYSDLNASAGALIIECGDRYEIISMNDLYGEVGRMENAESYVTNAIISVAAEDEKYILFTTGHGELQFDTLVKTAESKFFNVGTIDLRQNEVEKCDILAVCAPESDFTQQEIAAIERYVLNGGNLQIYFNPEASYLPNLAEYIKEWGIEVKNETVYEKNTNNVYAAYSGYLPEVPANDYTNGLKEALLYRQSFRLDILSSETYGITNFPVMTTTSKATTIVNSVDSELEGVYNIAVISERVLDDNSVAKMFVSGNTILFEESYANQFLGNADMAMAIIRGMLSSEEYVKIETKTSNAQGLQMTVAQIVFTLIVFVLISIGILILGIIKWSKRRFL